MSLELPVQWLWDIVDEFIYQFQVFCQYRSNLSNKVDDEIERLREAPQIWNVQTVMNILHSLADKANIVDQLRVAREGGNAAEAAGAYGQLNLYKMLGYFSLVGLLRLHCLLGDYYLALRSLDYVDMELNKKVRQGDSKRPREQRERKKKKNLTTGESICWVFAHAPGLVRACDRVPHHHLLLRGVRLRDAPPVPRRWRHSVQHPLLPGPDQAVPHAVLPV